MRSAWLDEEQGCGVRHSAPWRLNEPTQPKARSRTGLWLEASSGVSLRTLTSGRAKFKAGWGGEVTKEHMARLCNWCLLKVPIASGCSNTRPFYMTLNSLLG